MKIHETLEEATIVIFRSSGAHDNDHERRDGHHRSVDRPASYNLNAEQSRSGIRPMKDLAVIDGVADGPLETDERLVASADF